MRDRVKLDRTPNSTVAVCTCGWRCIDANRHLAALHASRHLSWTHGEAKRAHDLWKRVPPGVRST